MSFKGMVLALALLVPAAAYSQGYLTGSLESNTVYDDEPDSPYNGFHSNNYLRLDYTKGHFSAGLQGEWYPSPLPGYDQALKGFGIPLKYVKLDGSTWSVTLGDFYDQFGSGLVLRSWEDRDLGIANSIGGIRFNAGFFDDRLSLTVLSGAPRQGLGYAKSLVSGADANLRLGPLTLGSSLVARAEWEQEEDLSVLLGNAAPQNVLLYSGRAQLVHGPFQTKAEIVLKSRDFTAVHNATGSDSFTLEGGRAFTWNFMYSSKRILASVTYRYLYNMDFAARRTLGTKVLSNTLNYLPALCKQQTYMLACLNPYETYSEGESGFAGTVYYHPSWLKSLSLTVGGSWIDGLGKVLPLRETNYLAYRDIYFDAAYRWSKKLKTNLYVSIQESSPTHGNRKATNAQNVFVLDGTYKLSKKYSLHSELQYLYSQELTKDWMAALVEFGMAPNWSFSISDMYNHGSTKDHYWNVNASYNSGGVRIMAGYGRNREGMVCSGGVCRYQPEYKGAFLKVQWMF
jgi:hypothetical protein